MEMSRHRCVACRLVQNSGDCLQNIFKDMKNNTKDSYASKFMLPRTIINKHESWCIYSELVNAL